MTHMKKELQQSVMEAAAESNMSSVLFRNALGRRLNLNVTDSECLSLLGIRGISTPTELAHYTGLTTGSTTTMLDRLEKARYITRKPNPADRRGVMIEVSKHWGEVAGPLVADVRQAHAQLIASYSDKELAVILDFLTRFKQNVDTQTSIIEKDAK